MNYLAYRASRIAPILEGFAPDLSRSRNPGFVLEVLRLTKAGNTSKMIAEQLGCSPKAVQKTYRRYGFPNMKNLAQPAGEHNSNYNGHRSVNADGYVYVKAPVGHPLANSNGYIREHRLVMERHLGRYLTRDEVVHHIDDNPSNNAIGNLELFESNGAHLAKTLKGKCPEWSAEGKAAIVEAVKENHRQGKYDYYAASHARFSSRKAS